MSRLIKSTPIVKQSTSIFTCLTFLIIGMFPLVGLTGCKLDRKSGECFTTQDCNDNDPCTIDTCSIGFCTNVPIMCEDGQVCVDGVCELECMSDSDCDDMDLCTTNTCTSGLCRFPAVECDSSDLCSTGVCDSSTGDCAFTSTTCPPAETCDPSTGDCVSILCSTDEECDDGVFCNGAETCPDNGLPGIDADCQAGTNPCPDTPCIEATMSCETTSSGSTMSFVDVFGNYVSSSTCNGGTLTVFIGLDGSSFILEGLSGDNRGFFPDEDKDGLTTTATDVIVNGLPLNTVTLTLDPSTGVITMTITGSVNCTTELIPA